MELSSHQLSLSLSLCANVVFSGVHYYCFECTLNYLLLISGGLVYFLAVSCQHHYSYCFAFIYFFFFFMKRKARQNRKQYIFDEAFSKGTDCNYVA